MWFDAIRALIGMLVVGVIYRFEPSSFPIECAAKKGMPCDWRVGIISVLNESKDVESAAVSTVANEARNFTCRYGSVIFTEIPRHGFPRAEGLADSLTSHSFIRGLHWKNTDDHRRGKNFFDVGLSTSHVNDTKSSLSKGMLPERASLSVNVKVQGDQLRSVCEHERLLREFRSTTGEGIRFRDERFIGGIGAQNFIDRITRKTSSDPCFMKSLVDDVRLAHQYPYLEDARYYQQTTENPDSVVSPILDRLNAYSRYRTNLYGLFFILGCYVAALLIGPRGGGLRVEVAFRTSGWLLITFALACVLTGTSTGLIGPPWVWWNFFLRRD